MKKILLFVFGCFSFLSLMSCSKIEYLRGGDIIRTDIVQNIGSKTQQILPLITNHKVKELELLDYKEKNDKNLIIKLIPNYDYKCEYKKNYFYEMILIIEPTHYDSLELLNLTLKVNGIDYLYEINKLKITFKNKNNHIDLFYLAGLSSTTTFAYEKFITNVDMILIDYDNTLNIPMYQKEVYPSTKSKEGYLLEANKEIHLKFNYIENLDEYELICVYLCIFIDYKIGDVTYREYSYPQYYFNIKIDTLKHYLNKNGLI